MTLDFWWSVCNFNFFAIFKICKELEILAWNLIFCDPYRFYLTDRNFSWRIMDPNQSIVQSLTRPNSLITKNGSFYNPELLKDCKVFVLYFSAHWCPPCRQFTPILAQQFALHHQSSNKSMVIFVSGDRSQQEQLNYMREAHGDWPAVPCQSQLQT